jgi:uncharacterized GH25 family protein
MSARHFGALRRLGVIASAIVVSAAPVVAHDMWIEPTAFSLRSSEIVALRLMVGEDLLGDPLPRNSALIKQFIVEDTAGRRPVVGRDGADPAGLVRVATPGLLVIGYSSHPSRVELPAEQFNQYLLEEGLDAVTALRAQRSETTRGAREIFSRRAKSLVASGPQHEGSVDRSLGFALEIVAERNPYTLRAGDRLPVGLTYEGRPLAGALIVAFNRAHPLEKMKIRTDHEGRAVLRLSQPGLWLVKAIHMVPAPAGSNADWASYWASLTFELPAATSMTTAR